MKEAPWSLKDLREHARRMPGDQKFVLSAISSLDWSDRIFRYHFCEARDALRAIPIDKDDPASIKNHELLFMSSEEHEHSMLVVRANVIACIHTVRNAYDHLAQLCNALLLSPSIPVEKCDFHKVREHLPTSPLKQELDTLSASPWFKYVAAYSNTSKHRALVQQSMHLSPHTEAFGDGLFELRLKGQEGIARVFFCALIGRRVMMLHSFVKKSQKTPPRQLEVARKRMKEVKHANS